MKSKSSGAPPSLDWLAKAIGKELDRHLDLLERRRKAISWLSSGAAFESWLSFETRLLLEDRRHRLGLTKRSKDRKFRHFWLANEHRKVDLFIGDGEDGCLATLEFKLIHNNKNWEGKVNEVVEDLFPTRRTKSLIKPVLGRLAIVGLVGKAHLAGYPGGRNDIPAWTKDVRQKLKSSQRKGRGMRLIWEGRVFQLSKTDASIDSGVEGQFFQILILRAA